MERQPYSPTEQSELNKLLDDFEAAAEMARTAQQHLTNIRKSYEAAPGEADLPNNLTSITFKATQLRLKQYEVGSAIAEWLEVENAPAGYVHYYYVGDRLVDLMYLGDRWDVQVKPAPLTPKPWHIVVQAPEQPEPLLEGYSRGEYPAFPSGGDGMTYREWMVGQALMGVCSTTVHGSSIRMTAKSAIAIADACIAEIDHQT